MDDDLAFFAHTDAFRAYSGHILQRQMHDAALARGHGIQPEWLARSLHAFRGDARRHAQFFKPQRSVAAAIDVNLFMVSRFQPQGPEGEMFERFQYFRAALQENLFVLAVEIGEHFRVASRSFAFSRNRANVDLQVEPGNTHDILQKMAQGLGCRLPVQLPIADKFFSHRRSNAASRVPLLRCLLKTSSRARAWLVRPPDASGSNTTAARYRPR